jgi:hypothetical protein
MPYLIRGAVAIVGLLCGAWLVGKLVDTLAGENRRLVAAHVAVTPRDFGVLEQQHDTHTRGLDPVAQAADIIGSELERHQAGLRGEDIPTHPHGL